MPAQEVLQRFRLVAVANLANREAAPIRIRAGVGIGAMLEQQLGDLQLIRTTSLEQRPAVRSRVFGPIRIGTVFQQPADNVQMTLPRRVRQRADTRRVEAPGQADILS